MTRYHFLKINSNPKRIYTAEFLNRSPRFICFTRKRDAKLFKQYITFYRAVYGKWPEFDENHSVHTPIDNPMKPTDIEVSITSKRIDQLTYMGSLSDTNFNIFSRFDLIQRETASQGYTLSFDVHEFDVDVIESAYIDSLEDLLDS